MEIISSIPRHPQADDPYPKLNQSGFSLGRWAFLLVVLSVMGWVFFRIAAKTQESSQIDPASLNQPAVMVATKAVEPSLRPSISRGVVGGFYEWCPQKTVQGIAPLWPWIAAHHLPEDDSQTFRQGQSLNLMLSLGFLILFGLAAATELSILTTINVCLLLGFGVLLPRSLFYQPDALFCILYLLSILCAVRLLKRNSAWRHVQFGVVCGLAFLTKVTILPLLFSWALITVLRFLCGMFRRSGEKPWDCRGQFIGLLGFAFAFVAVCAPSLHANKELQGNYLAPVIKEYTRQADEPPVMQNWQEHLLKAGVVRVAQLFSPSRLPDKAPEGAPHLLALRGSYLWALVVAFLVAALYSRSRGPAWFQDGPPTHQQTLPIVMFLFLTFLVEVAVAALYHPEDLGEQHILHLYAPIAVTLVVAGESLRRWAERRGGGGRGFQLCYHAIHLTVAVHLSLCLFALFPR